VRRKLRQAQGRFHEGLLLAFSSLNLHASLSRAIGDLGFEKPTPIQVEAIPAGLAGRDVLAA
jgi:superfamily II DNA/RNA helicase